MSEESAVELLEHWFGQAGDGWTISADRIELWFGRSDETDADLRRRFGRLHERASAGELSSWEADPRSKLALLLLFDQLSRNLHRGTPDAFANDPRALGLAREMIDRGEDRELRPIERPFVYLPLEHAEDLEAQHRAVEAFRALRDEAPEAARAGYETLLDYAERHLVVIERFGRFPHRNAILGRESTTEEEAFLLEPGSSF